MNRTSVNSFLREMPARVQAYRHRRILIRGLRRLRRWQKLLQPVLRAMRQPQPVTVRVPKLPMMLQLGSATLLWALTTTEELYLLLQEIAAKTEQAISEMSQRD